MSTYLVKETFLTLQGEGMHGGRPAVFCRFSGCNLWTGREEHRAQAVCRFCDTDFVGTDGPGGGHFRSARALAEHVRSFWPSPGRGFVVCTGGEPTLQLDDAAVAALHAVDLEIAIETNGTRPVPAGVDWVCVSPKAGAEVVLERADELKLVVPQPGAEPERWVDFAADHHLLQPMDGPDRVANTAAAVAYCLEHPTWRLSVQTHKDIGIP
ncbi:7-carboxy-7-deazaguanine synthase [Rhabdothermincola salaria]|uniref:7-carboxy-7-deazaguanine synthase n=1 Tax=Rhabdothermincola salaria TaxID=2903142 RepID=UPI001E28F46B|nr:7-carboxy-7-deazaguanine synthase [Rhabdothermincola salaria]MCD9623854.1 7-carboxy-7-deazaguanine synthase [Rhabdothermincola salaria]